MKPHNHPSHLCFIHNHKRGKKAKITQKEEEAKVVPMKKLYKKGKVHPTGGLISDQLSFLPAAILTLTVALSTQDREVLAYLLSCSTTQPQATNNKHPHHKSFSIAEHPPLFYCNCFRCYTSYWSRWDSSPNRQLIHDIIDAFEDELTRKKQSSKKDRKKNKKKQASAASGSGCNNIDAELGKDVQPAVATSGGSSGDEGGEGGEEFDKGAVRKFVTFVGETIWGVWN